MSRWAGRAGVAVAAAALACATGSPAHAVAAGSPVPDGRYPFAVKLTDLGIPTADGGRRDSSCSGALVAPHWVLTAGHCFRDQNDVWVSHTVADRTIATVGRTDLTGTAGHEANVVAVRQQGTADISLARLDRAITDIRPLRIARSRPRVGDTVRLTGYGLTTAAAATSPTRLLTGEFTVSSVTALEAGMTGLAPHPDTSPCPHDSGGPYFTEDAGGAATVVGVVSHGPDCPHTGPDMAARVDAVAAWILSVIGTDLAASPAPATRPPGRSPAAARSATPAAPATNTVLIAAAAGLLGVVAVAVLRFGGRRRGGTHRRDRP